MTNSIGRLALTGTFIGAVVIACSGGSKPPATSSSSGGTDTSDAAAIAPPVAEADAGATPPVASSEPDAGSTAAPAPTASAAPPKDDDECIPVAVDFEKRARPKLKECYREGKKKEPDLKGTVKIKLTVDLKGKIKSTKVIEKTLPEPVVSCMLKSVMATPFPEVEKCWDRTITIPITFPTPP